MKTAARIMFFFSLFVFLVTSSCQKNVRPTTPEEENLSVETTPTSLNNHVESPAPGPDFTLKVTVKSKMPSGGVKIDVVARPENSQTPFYTNSRSNSLVDNSFTITNTPRTISCIVQTTVTSLSKSSNVWTGSFRYSRK